MPKTKTIEISTSDELRIKAYRGSVTAIIEDPQVEDMLAGVHKEDLITFIQSEGYSPDDIFDEEKLREWANENGYIKE